MTKFHKELQLLIGSGGIYASFMIYGYYQEKIFNKQYGDQQFIYAFAVLLFQYMIIAIGCQVYQFVNRKQLRKQHQITTKDSFIQGTLNFTSTLMTNTALKFVSFPLQCLTKSAKILSIILVGLLMGRKFTKQEICCGIIITVGISIFNIYDDKKHKDDVSDSLLGIGMLVFSLLCDGYLATHQSVIKEKGVGLFQLMRSCANWAFLESLLYGFFQGEIIGFINIISSQRECFFDLLTLAISGGIGQLFIFYTINAFNPKVLGLVTTTRKFFTLLASIIIYQHPMNIARWIAVSLIFYGIGWEIHMGYKKKNQKKD